MMLILLDKVSLIVGRDSIDTSCSRGEWGFDPKYDLASMTKLMLEAIEQKILLKIITNHFHSL